jgi:hypothetical protein
MGLYQFTWAAAGAMFGAGLGAITGIALVWLLRAVYFRGIESVLHGLYNERDQRHNVYFFPSF